jgi:glutathione S-transferase
VDDQIVFESSVITEFINDISSTSIHPENVITKANNRSWIAFSSSIFDDLFGLVTGDEDKFNASKTSLFTKLEKLENAKGDGTFFNGESFNMIDAALAPIFMRLAWMNEFTDNALSISEFKTLSAWSDEILAVKEVQASVIDGIDDVYYSNIEGREGYLSTLLVDEEY